MSALTPREATQLVGSETKVRLVTGQGDTLAEGKVISYSIVPTITIVTDEGQQISWRHDMAEVVE